MTINPFSENTLPTIFVCNNPPPSLRSDKVLISEFVNALL